MVAGCAERKADDYKAKVDRTAYRLIDEQWQDKFGGKANYKISDVEPSPNDIQVEKAAPTTGILALPQAVSIATAHNRHYQLEKEKLYVKALDLRLARHEFEPWLFGAAGGGYVMSRRDQVKTTPVHQGIGGEEYVVSRTNEAMTTQAGLGVQQLLATGTRIGVNVTSAWIEVLTGNARGGLSNVLTATVTQPLLRGSDPNVIRENLTQAERDMLYQIRLFNRFRKTFVVSVISQYYFVLQAYDAASNARDNYNTLVEVCSRAEKLAGAGRLPQFELDQARQDKLLAWDSYVQAEKIYKQALDDFKIALALPTESEFQLDVNELVILHAVKMTGPDFSETEALETALACRGDYANSADAVQDAERKVLVALDNLRMDLSVTAATKQQTRVVSDPVTLRNARSNGQVGLNMDLNLDKVSGENEYRLALITLNQHRRDYEQLMDTVILEVRKAYRDMAEASERYKGQSEQLALAGQRFDNTQLLLEYGRANTRDVLDAQKDLLKARNAATQAMVNYTVALLSFYRDVDVLQVRPDGMWQL
jgi:outer membrane protein TolC